MLPILTTTENAFASASLATMESASLAVSVYTGLDNENKGAPCIICSCPSATEDFPQSGVWHIRASIIVKEMAADTSVTSSLATTVFEYLTDMSTTALANCTSSFAVYDVFVDGQEHSQDEDAWVQTLNLQVVGCLT